MRAYRVGLSRGDLKDRLYTVGRTDLALNDQDIEVGTGTYLPFYYLSISTYLRPVLPTVQ